MKVTSSIPPITATVASYLTIPDGSQLAYLHHAGSSPGVLFCPGFQSNMRGRKVEALMHWCQTVAGCEFTCFDYFGQGESLPPPQLSIHDIVKQCTVGRWLQDTLSVLDTVTLPQSKQILVGSSMGAWLAILVAKARPDRIAGIIGVASAPDAFQSLANTIQESPHLSQSMNSLGYSDVPSRYSETGYYRIHRELLQESRNHSILSINTPLEISVPVRLIHGKEDKDVPWQQSQLLYDTISALDKQILYIDDGDHRLSREQDLHVLIHQLEQVLFCRRISVKERTDAIRVHMICTKL